MILCFQLSMPNVGSWNGKWTGENNLFVIIKNMGRTKTDIEKAKKILDKGYYHYNFGDGWAAGVSIRQVDGYDARKLRRVTKGFSGYDWMVDSIINIGEIRPRTFKDKY